MSERAAPPAAVRVALVTGGIGDLGKAICHKHVGIMRDMTFRRMTQAGMHGFTKALALEVAPKGVTVNTISPDHIGMRMVPTIPREVLDGKILPQIPLGQLGRHEEVAGLVACLASKEAAFVTSANIAINGGQHMI